MPGSMGGNTPVGVPMGGHMTEQMEDQIRNMMEQVLMPFQEQVMSKLCSVEENLQRRLDGVLATYDAINALYPHGHMRFYFLHFRACIQICIHIYLYGRFFQYIHRHRKRHPQMNVNLRLSNSGIPGIPGFATL